MAPVWPIYGTYGTYGTTRPSDHTDAMTPRPPGGRTRGHLILMVDNQNLSADRHLTKVWMAESVPRNGGKWPAFGTVSTDRVAILSKVRSRPESGCFRKMSLSNISSNKRTNGQNRERKYWKPYKNLFLISHLLRLAKRFIHDFFQSFRSIGSIRK